MTVQQQDPTVFPAQAENLSRTHREHELHYSQAPPENTVTLQQLSQTLKALAGHWLSATPQEVEHPNQYAGCDDLNVQTTIETLGLLFLEGEGEPAAITRIKRELSTRADDHEQTGAWLGEAMQSAWKTASDLLRIDPLAELLAEQHRIIAANRQTASLSVIIGALLRRAVEILDVVEFTPTAIRDDLAGKRLAPRYLHAAAELIDRAADLQAEGAALVDDSERRSRAFHDRIETIRETEARTDASHRSSTRAAAQADRSVARCER